MFFDVCRLPAILQAVGELDLQFHVECAAAGTSGGAGDTLVRRPAGDNGFTFRRRAEASANMSDLSSSYTGQGKKAVVSALH